MANPTKVYLKLQHGETYTDHRSGVRFTRDNPVQPVTEARARELLKEVAPLYAPDGSSRGNVRRFKLSKEPPPPAEPTVLDGDDDLVNDDAPNDLEIDAEIRASQASAPPADPVAEADAPPPAPAAPPTRQRNRLPRNEGEGSGGTPSNSPSGT